MQEPRKAAHTHKSASSVTWGNSAVLACIPQQGGFSIQPGCPKSEQMQPTGAILVAIVEARAVKRELEQRSWEKEVKALSLATVITNSKLFIYFFLITPLRTPYPASGKIWLSQAPQGSPSEELGFKDAAIGEKGAHPSAAGRSPRTHPREVRKGEVSDWPSVCSQVLGRAADSFLCSLLCK